MPFRTRGQRVEVDVAAEPVRPERLSLPGSGSRGPRLVGRGWPTVPPARRKYRPPRCREAYDFRMPPPGPQVGGFNLLGVAYLALVIAVIFVPMLVWLA